VGLIRNLGDREKACARCSKELGLRSHDPELIWEYQGKLCHSCYQVIGNGIKVYEVTYSGGHSQLPVQVDALLTLLLFDRVNKIIFAFRGKEKDKDNLHISFHSSDMKGCKIVSKNKSSLKKTNVELEIGFNNSTSSLTVR